MEKYNRIHVGQMLITERPTGTQPTKSKLFGRHELLLMDGSEIDKKRYPTLAKLLQTGGYGKYLPSETQELDIQDHYVVARRLTLEEVAEIKKYRG